MLLVYWQVDTGRYSIPVFAFFFQLKFTFLINLFACMIDQKSTMQKKVPERYVNSCVMRGGSK